MKLFNKKCIVVAMVVLAVASLGGCGKIKNTEVVATVGKDEISGGVANFYARMQQAQTETYYGSYMSTEDKSMWEQELEKGTTYEESIKKTTLESLENLYLLNQHVSDYDVKISDEEKAAIKKAAKKFVESNTLEEKKVVSGDQEYVQKVLELMTVQSKMEEAMKQGVDENVSDEDAAQKSMEYVTFAYTTTDADGNEVEATEEEKAAQLKAAQDFQATIKKNNLSAAAKKANLEVQTATFDSESTSPDADVIKAIDAIETEGTVTDVIQTDTGCYICKLTSLLDRDATDKKKQEIVDERKQDQYDKLLKEFRKDTKIEVNESAWKKISFIDQGVTMKQEIEEPYATGTDGTANTDAAAEEPAE